MGLVVLSTLCQRIRFRHAVASASCIIQLHSNQINSEGRRTIKELSDTLTYFGQEDSLRPTDKYETLYKLRWGWVRESGILKMQLQRIPLAVWHHPCTMNLYDWLEGASRWQICAEPLLDPHMKGEQNGDSGGGVLRYDSAAKKYFLLGVLSKSKKSAVGTVLLATVDTYADYHMWMRVLEG